MNRVFSTIAKKSIINIAPNAWDKMKLIINKNNQFFILSANSGGCNGFNYELSLHDNVKLEDYITNSNKFPINIVENNNVKVLIEPTSEFLLIGTTIDFISEDFNKGIFDNKFIFIPDKELNNGCGCGISFSPKKI